MWQKFGLKIAKQLQSSFKGPQTDSIPYLHSPAVLSISMWQYIWYDDVASLNFILSFSFLMIWCIVLNELKHRILLKSLIKHKNDMLNVAILINMIPILLSKHTWFFCCFTKTSSKHSVFIASISFHNSSWIQFLVFSYSDISSLMNTAFNPGFICP